MTPSNPPTLDCHQRGRVFFGLLLSCLAAMATAPVAAAEEPAAKPYFYTEHAEVTKFIGEMVAEHSFSAEWLRSLFAQVQRNDFTLETIARPAEKVLSWEQYRARLVDVQRVRDGMSFWNENAAAIRRASQDYGVAEEIIVAIIGVETRYGRITGRHRIIDTLATLGFDYPPRQKFFRQELKEFLLLSREQGFDPLALTGSYAGAMGYGQFMPSSYRNFAVDFDADGVADLIGNRSDAIGSVANYLAKNGWRAGRPVALRATLRESADKSLLNRGRRPSKSIAALSRAGIDGVIAVPPSEKALALAFGDEQPAEYWLGLHNFGVIMSYNPRHFYAMAVYLLSRELLLAHRTGASFSK